MKFVGKFNSTDLPHGQWVSISNSSEISSYMLKKADRVDGDKSLYFSYIRFDSKKQIVYTKLTQCLNRSLRRAALFVDIYKNTKKDK